MREQLVSFETAKLAKEKGFNIKTISFYHNNTFIKGLSNNRENHNDTITPFYSAPTQSLLQKWLREKHNIIIIVDANNSSDTRGDINAGKDYTNFGIKLIKNTRFINGEWNHYQLFLEYEDCLEYGLEEALKLIEI